MEKKLLNWPETGLCLGDDAFPINQSTLFFAMLVIKQEKYNAKLETKTKQCAGRLRADLAVFKSAATVN